MLLKLCYRKLNNKLLFRGILTVHTRPPTDDKVGIENKVFSFLFVYQAAALVEIERRNLNPL